MELILEPTSKVIVLKMTILKSLLCRIVVPDTLKALHNYELTLVL